MPKFLQDDNHQEGGNKDDFERQSRKRQIAFEILEGLNSGDLAKISLDPFTTGNEVLELLETAGGDGSEKSKIENASIFLNVLLESIEHLSNREHRQEALERGWRAYQMFFAATGNIFELLPLGERLEFATRATRIPEVQASFGDSLLSNLAYTFSWDVREEETLAEYIAGKDLGEVLDIIHQLRTLAAQCDGQPEEAAMRGRKEIEQLVELLKAKLPYPIVQYAADASLSRIRNEERSIGVIHRMGDRSSSRMVEAMTAEEAATSEDIAKRISSGFILEPGLRYTKVAQDGISALDHSGLPRFIIKEKLEELAPPQRFSLIELDYSVEIFMRVQDADGLARAIKYLAEAVIIPEREIKTYEELGEAMHEAAPSLSVPEWTELLIEGPLLPEDNVQTVRQELLSYTKGLYESCHTKYTEPEVESYVDISKDEELMPFGDRSSNSENAALLLRHLHDPEMFARLQKDLGVDLRAISLAAQIQLLQYLAASDTAEYEEFKNALGKDTESNTLILNAFLANSEDPKFSAEILKLAKQGESGMAVLSKYKEITDVIDSLRNITDRTVARNLIVRANRIIERFAKETEGEESKVMGELEQIRAENELFLATFKALPKEAREEALREAKDVRIEELHPGELSEEDTKRMELMYTHNYSDKKYANLLPLLLEKFRESLKDSSARFVIFRHKGIVRGFLRFTGRPDGSTYFGAFNVDPTYSGAAIGETMIDQAIEAEARTHVIYADCEANSRIGKKYLEHGFKKIREYELGGVPSWEIKRDDLSARSASAPAQRERVA